jgi:hypothetical protein
LETVCPPPLGEDYQPINFMMKEELKNAKEKGRKGKWKLELNMADKIHTDGRKIKAKWVRWKGICFSDDNNTYCTKLLHHRSKSPFRLPSPS